MVFFALRPLASFCLGLTLFVGGVSLLRADENDYRLRIGEKMLTPYSVSPRATGMGGSYVAINDGAHGSYQNPASLAGIQADEGFTNFGIESINESSKSGTVLSVNMGGALHLNSMRKEYYQQRDVGNQAIGMRYSYVHGGYNAFNDLSQSGNLVNLGFGRSFIYDRVLAGVSLGYHTTRITDNNLFEMDITRYEVRSGTIVRITEAFALGGVFSFGNGGIEPLYLDINGKGDVSHLELRGGGSLQLNERLMVTSDMSLRQLEMVEKKTAPQDPKSELHEIIEWSVGGEGIVIPELLTARGGFYVGNDAWDTVAMPEYGNSRNKGYAGIAWGLSYYHDNWGLDYGLQLETTGDTNHSVSLLLEF